MNKRLPCKRNNIISKNQNAKRLAEDFKKSKKVISIFVCKEIIIEDNNGNKKIARETQFINTMKNIKGVYIKK